MHIEAWDEVFIRCRRTSANALVAHVPTWGSWWPGLAVAGTDGSYGLTFRTPLRLPTSHRLHLRVDRVRPRDKGLEFSLVSDEDGADRGGHLVGTGEWYHLDRADGVVVHYLLRGDLTGASSGQARRWVAAHRASVRAALTAMKARLEAGRPPGAEPDPALLAHQAQELAIFAREVAQHEAERAAAASSTGLDAPVGGLMAEG